MRCVALLVCVLSLSWTNAEEEEDWGMEADGHWGFGNVIHAPDNRLATCQKEKKACHAARLRDRQEMECPRHLSALISGSRYRVPSNDLTASASWRADHGPQCSRLESPRIHGCYASMWSAPGINKAKTAWIQADLGAIFEVWMVATQGRGFDQHSQWVTKYKLSTALYRHNHGFTFYQKGKAFKANRDQNSIVTNALRPPMVGRFIRLYPLTFHGHRSLRWELYGRKKNCVSVPTV